MRTDKSLSVPDWYAGQNVLITGATGFMGKVMVEKLLRSCSEVSAVYVLIRSKKGKNAKQRLTDLLKNPLFDKLNSVENLQCVAGDVCSENLGLSEKDRLMLQENVTVFFHMAANVRFDQPLKSAIKMNTGSALHAVEFATTFRNLKAFVHVSTCYCHCDQSVLEEKTYPAPHDPRRMMELASWMENDLVQVLSPHILKNSPNTYAYTKCLSEHLVAEYASKIKVAIARPSIVTPVWREPIPGWHDNLNGPIGMLVAAAKGVLRTMHCDAKKKSESIPVDVAINSIILTGWKLANSPRSEKPYVVNINPRHDTPITWGEIVDASRKNFRENPFSVCLWYPNGSIKSNYLLHLISLYAFQLIPAYVIDFLLTIAMQKPFLVKMQKRLLEGLDILQYYTTRNWFFHNDRIRGIWDGLNEQDKETFYCDSPTDIDQYLLDCLLACRKYVFREDPSTIPNARKIQARLYALDLTVKLLLVAGFFWTLYSYVFPIFTNFLSHF